VLGAIGNLWPRRIGVKGKTHPMSAFCDFFVHSMSRPPGVWRATRRGDA
jgi:hypothetical protein